jgi:hypothetical protein
MQGRYMYSKKACFKNKTGCAVEKNRVAMLQIIFKKPLLCFYNFLNSGSFICFNGDEINTGTRKR